jgi:hypothetical protein
MAILLPALQRARNQARAVVCQYNLRQWGTLFNIYTDENDGRFFNSYSNATNFLQGTYKYKDNNDESTLKR